MPTENQIDYLRNLISLKTSRKDDPHKYIVYTKRIRESIDKELEGMLWISANCPDVLTDEIFEIENFGTVKHRRLKIMMQIVKNIVPDADPILIKIRKDIGLSENSQPV